MKRTLSAFLAFLFVAGMAHLYTKFPIGTIAIISGSMEPTLMKGDLIFVLPFNEDKPKEIKRGDIVSLEDPEEDDAGLVKRIIGLPGDHIFINKGKLFLNGKELKESYLKEKQMVYKYGPIIVPEGKVFVLGDNRNISQDSSIWGPISEKELLDKIMLVYYPWRRFGTDLKTHH